MTTAIPDKVKTMPNKLIRLNLSPKIMKPNNAVMGGDVAIMSIETLEPISKYD